MAIQFGVFLFRAFSGARVLKGGAVTVRLRGIDAPEKDQPYGSESRESLKEMVQGRTVDLEVKDIDRYGRVVSYVWVEGINVNLEQVKRGLAWSYREFLDRPYAGEFYEAEKEARSKHLGLWTQRNPIPPWEWRSMKR